MRLFSRKKKLTKSQKDELEKAKEYLRNNRESLAKEIEGLKKARKNELEELKKSKSKELETLQKSKKQISDKELKNKEDEIYKKFQESQKLLQEKRDKVIQTRIEELKKLKQQSLEEAKLKQEQEEKLAKSRQLEEEMLLEKLKNSPDGLYDPTQIDKIEDSVSVRIFYDPTKKQKKYWESTDVLDRIKYSTEEIQNELQVKQNKLTLRISTEHGTANKFAQLISGGNYNFWDHDSAGYYFQAHLSIDEEFLKKIITKHIRWSVPDMAIYESKLAITSFLPRTKVDYGTATVILQRITKAICDEVNSNLGSVLIEERLRR